MKVIKISDLVKEGFNPVYKNLVNTMYIGEEFETNDQLIKRLDVDLVEIKDITNGGEIKTIGGIKNTKKMQLERIQGIDQLIKSLQPETTDEDFEKVIQLLEKKHQLERVYKYGR